MTSFQGNKTYLKQLLLSIAGCEIFTSLLIVVYSIELRVSSQSAIASHRSNAPPERPFQRDRISSFL
jgi:hypothetical protein